MEYMFSICFRKHLGENQRALISQLIHALSHEMT